jgi:predicted O-methyltransferase YrrM
MSDSSELWSRVDDYLDGLYAARDAVLEHVLRSSEEAGLPPIQVSATHGKHLALMAQIVGARRILELGTLAGYSAIWMARTLPADGKLITLEYDPKHAEVARANFVKAGLDKLIEVRVGPALDTLPKLVTEGAGPFDLIFLDATKEEYAEYFDWSLGLSRSGTVIIADNVVRDGEVANAAAESKMAQGARRFHARVASEPRVSATAIQTVGNKGYDGFSLIRVL